jgi:hypothetical protein
VVWIADLLPGDPAPKIATMIEEGISVMEKALGT